jgi:rubrerythrin
MKRYKANESIDSWRIDCPCGAIIDACAGMAYTNSLGQYVWICRMCGQEFTEDKKLSINLQ